MTVLGKVISNSVGSLSVELPLEGKIVNISQFRKDCKIKDMCKSGDYLVIEGDMLPTGQFEVLHMSFCKI